MNKFDRYLKVVNWASNRYVADGTLVLSIGGQDSPYTRIEKLAARKILSIRIGTTLTALKHYAP